MNKLIDLVIRLGVIVALILAAVTKQQYSYFTFLRWLMMIVSIYFAYQSYENKQIGLLIYYAAIVILFNPFEKFWFQKETWHLIDFIIAGITIFTIKLDSPFKSKNSTNQNLKR